MNAMQSLPHQAVDRVIWRNELQKLLRVKSNAVRLWIKKGKLPPPDVHLSRKTQGWRLSTLQAAGIGLV